jgi:hypothetical protein
VHNRVLVQGVGAAELEGLSREAQSRAR